MREPLYDASITDFAGGQQKGFNDIVAGLQHKVTPGTEFSDLQRRRNACEQVQELEKQDQNAARALTPLLVDVVQAETQRHREMSSAQSMVLRGKSNHTQQQALAALRDLAGPELVDQYERASQPLNRIIRVLLTGVQKGATVDARIDALRALGAIGWSRPEAVIGHVAKSNVIESICGVVTHASSERARRPGMRLLALIATRNPDEFPGTSLIRDVLEDAVQNDDQPSRAFGLLVAHETTIGLKIEDITSVTDVKIANGRVSKPVQKAIDGKWITQYGQRDEQYPPIEFLRDECEIQRGLHRMATVASIGEVVAASPDPPANVPRSLCERVRNTTGTDVLYPAVAIGELVIDSQSILEGSFPKNSHPKRRAARVIGEMTAHIPDPYEYINQGLLDRVRETTGEDSRLAEAALGFFVSFYDTHTEEAIRPEVVPRYLCQLSLDTGPEDAMWVSQVLGEMYAHEPTDLFDTVPDQLFTDVLESAGEHRREAAQRLGLAISPQQKGHEFDSLARPFVDEIHDATIVEHDGFAVLPDLLENARALGLLVAYHPESTDKFSRSLLDAARTSPREELNLTALTLGIIYSAPGLGDIDTTSEEAMLQDICQHIHASTGRQRWLPAMAAGFLSTHLNLRENKFQSLYKEILSVEDALRKYAVHAMGEVIAHETAKDFDSQTLIREVKNSANEERKRVSRALGEAAAMGCEGFENVPQSLSESIRGATSWDRRRTAMALGEIIAHQTAGDVVALLRNQVHSDDSRDRRRAAHALGEYVASQQDNELPSSLVDRVRRGHGETRRRAAIALGEYAAYQPDSYDDIITALTKRACIETPEETKRKSQPHRRALRVLGEVASHQKSPHTEEIPEELRERVRSTSVHERTLANRVFPPINDSGEGVSDDHELVTMTVAEIILAGSLTAAVQTLGQRVLEGGRKRSAMSLFLIANCDAVDCEQFIGELSNATSQNRPAQANLTPYFETENSIREVLLSTFDMSFNQHVRGATAKHVNAQLTQFLAETDSLPASSRLTSIEILSKL